MSLGQPFAFSEKYDKAEVERAVYIYTMRSQKDIEELVHSRQTPSDVRLLETCWTTLRAISKFLQVVYDLMKSDLKRDEVNNMFPDVEWICEFEREQEEIRECQAALLDAIYAGAPGSWRIVGHLRHVWGENCLDLEWIKRQEKLGPDENNIGYSIERFYEQFCLDAMQTRMRFLKEWKAKYWRKNGRDHPKSELCIKCSSSVDQVCLRDLS